MQVPLDDPCLPPAAEALDPAAAARRFDEAWRAEGRALGSCRVASVEYEPGVRLAAVYELRAGASQAARTLGAVVVTPEGTRAWLYHQDPSLAVLATLTRHDEMLARVAALPRAVAGGSPVRDCDVVPVRYKPGRGCVLRLDLSTGAGARRLFAKVVPGQGERLAATLATLHAAAAAAAELPRVPAVALWADLDTVVQPEVPDGAALGRHLLEPRPSAEGDRAMKEAGAALAEFHDLDLPAPARTWPDDLSELGSYVPVVARLAPELRGSFELGLEQLRDHPGDEGERVASHGALRTDQVLVGRDGIAFIDLDGFCRAPPARDVANLLAYLDWRDIRGVAGAAAIARARTLFLEGYRLRRTLPDDRSGARYLAASMLKIAGRRFRSLSVSEWPFVPRLLSEAHAALGA